MAHLEIPAVILVTPNRTDADSGTGFLQEAGIPARACPSLAELCRMPLAEVGCAVLVEEALLESELDDFLRFLAAQPAWSDLPLVLVASAGAALGALVERVFPESGNVAVLERPLHPVSLVSAVRVGLRSRHRQLEVRHLLEQRDDALRKRDEFLAMLAHELRNPLAPLRNAVYLMKQLELSGTLATTRDLIDRQTSHLKRLVDDLLDVSRLELAKVQLKPQEIDVNTAVARAAETCQPIARARRHTLEVRLATEPPTISADPVRFEQIVCNLLVNAAKFTPEGGVIRVETGTAGDMAVVTVSDSGIGITADMLDRVFDLFTQDKKTLERAGGGLGIGLTIVRRLVELHRGTVSVHSAGSGKGTQFTVSLPRIAASVTHPVAEQGEQRAAAKRVLVVEDNADIRESLGMILRMWGHEVEFAETGAQGLQRAKEIRPEVALIDIGLPELNGYEVARGIRSEDAAWANDVTLVALTGYGRDADRDEALGAGFDCHLVKPVDLDVLAKALKPR